MTFAADGESRTAVFLVSDRILGVLGTLTGQSLCPARGVNRSPITKDRNNSHRESARRK